jgi:hypothetical protein
MTALAAAVLLSGCATVPRGSIPVVDAGVPVSNGDKMASGGSYRPLNNVPKAVPQDSGVVVMVPGGNAASAAPIQSYPAASAPIVGSVTGGSSVPVAAQSSGGFRVIKSGTPSGIPGAAGLTADEQLDGPVLALLTTAQQQQSSGDLNGASSSLERAQRIAPREPQVLYRLAEVSLAQGNAAQAEQLARRGLSYANGRASLQASLWALIAQARERQGDPAGAAEARQHAQVNL